ncbi:hypothetical protein [Algicola sagamiensis]|uniref:hypothetical protein n=1 Tax=Algicola sagamiensis TaxID=163869 RepID=UPI00037E5EC3|nr:hypothetical protein [Algicola sagamiensis]
MAIYLVLLGVSFITTYLLGDVVLSLGYIDYKDTLGALLNISSIIFAIIGAWIAIIYPKAMNKVVSGKSNDSSTLEDVNSDANYLSQLIEIVLVSSIVLMLVLCIQFTAPIAKAIIEDSTYIKWAKYSVFFVISWLAMAQIYAVLRVIVTNYHFLGELRRKHNDAKIDALHR